MYTRQRLLWPSLQSYRLLRRLRYSHPLGSGQWCGCGDICLSIHLRHRPSPSQARCLWCPVSLGQKAGGPPALTTAASLPPPSASVSHLEWGGQRAEARTTALIAGACTCFTLLDVAHEVSGDILVGCSQMFDAAQHLGQPGSPYCPPWPPQMQWKAQCPCSRYTVDLRKHSLADIISSEVLRGPGVKQRLSTWSSSDHFLSDTSFPIGWSVSSPQSSLQKARTIQSV